MAKYLRHLEGMYSDKTFNRKIDYLKFNFSGLLTRANLSTFSVLEIGPGMGECISYLNSLGVHNIDIVDNDREIINRSKKKFKIRKAILNQNITSIDNTLGSYNLIVLIQVLEHIATTKHKEVIQTLFKHLKKRGSIIIVVPNANNPLGIVERYADLQHYTAFTEQSLKDLVVYSGIKNFILKIKGFEIPPYSPINLIRIVLQKILHLILFLVMVVNGGNFFRIMTPNIMLVVKKNPKTT